MARIRSLRFFGLGFGLELGMGSIPQQNDERKDCGFKVVYHEWSLTKRASRIGRIIQNW